MTIAVYFWLNKGAPLNCRPAFQVPARLFIWWLELPAGVILGGSQ